MSTTILCVLVKVLILARADIMSKYPDSDSIQNLKYDRSHIDHLDNENVRNKIDEISFANMSVIPESIESNLNKPTSPRAFVEFHNGFLNEEHNISVTFRWDQPNFADEVIQGYTVQCWFIENQKKIQICNDKSISTTILEYTEHNLKSNMTYHFRVQAHTKVGVGPYTDIIDISTTHENPIPQLLIKSSGNVYIFDLDSKIVSVFLVEQHVVDIAFSIAEHKIYWSNEKKDLMSLDKNENNITKIARLERIAYHLCIDWIARNLYWAEFELGELNNIIKLDLTMWENNSKVKYDKISKAKNNFDTRSIVLTILPFLGTLYWINVYNNAPQIIQSDLDGKNSQKFQKNLSVVCPFSFNMPYIMDAKIDIHTEKPLIYWLMQDLLIVTDINISICNSILQAKEIKVTPNFDSLTIDKTNIYLSIIGNYWYEYIYILKKNYLLFESVDTLKYFQNIEATQFQMYAFGKSLQLYPPTKCLIPDKKVHNVEIVMITTNSIIVNLPEPVPKSGCKRYNLPSTLYTIYISYCLDNKLNKFNNFTVKTYEQYYEIQNLTSFTEHKLQLALSNFYSDRLSMDPLFVWKMILRTKPSRLDAPENVTVQALTPTTAAVYWMPPKKLNCIPVIYELHWTLINLVNNTQQISESLLINKTEHKIDSNFFTKIESLIPGQQYRVFVRIYPANFSDHYNNSLRKILYMYSEPNNITLDNVSTNSMNISWISSVNLTINYTLEYKNVKMQKWQMANNIEVNNGEKVMYYINNLLPGSLYEFRLILKYSEYEKNFIWPSDGRFTFSTLTSNISSNPGNSLVTQYYQYIIPGLVAVLVIICVCYSYYLYRQHNKSNQQGLPPIMTDIELAILHEIPNGNIQFNMLYSSTLEYNSNEYVRVKREQIILEKLLGSGAFGMVFQGKVMNLEKSGTEIPVAIKKLRKNASSQEKKKFLEEATLMNHFRHKHVLRLLAVCLDQESPLIVLELMETDLLKYLRDNRKLEPSYSHALRLQDLFAMCEDIARGCCYLEDLRFVHRDLACRNCLVSSRDRENRVVKIGDFGLARDIYKNDYYRVKEQNFLPVCWMAPESLRFKIFTSKSDVWSFGVLMWEITSLGEHPYVGMTNLEAIDYVCNGGRLRMPLNCPPTLYEVMLRCWNPANDRPTFKLCLKDIIALRSNIEDTLLIVNPMHII